MAIGQANRTPPGQGNGAAAMTAGAAPAPSSADEDETNVTPEEQEQYNQFVTNGMQLMYSEQSMPQLIQTIKSGGTPVEGIANALATLVMRLEDSSGQQGAEISGDAKFHGASEILGQMAELAEQAGVPEFSEEDIESALYLALDIYRTTRQKQGKLPEGDIAQDMQTLMQAEQQGRLDEILPGIQEAASKGGAPQGSGQPPGRQRRGLMRRG